MSLVSIIIPCFDKGAVVLEAVESVRRNTYEPKELIVVNDGSTDPETIRAIDSLRHRGIHVVDQQNSGLASARNRGYRESSGDFLVFLDHDDLISSNYLREGVSLLQGATGISYVYGDTISFGEHVGLHTATEFDASRLRRLNFIHCSSVFRRECFISARYDPDVLLMEDWDFLLQLEDNGHLGKAMHSAYLFYRLVRNSSMNYQVKMKNRIRQVVAIRRKHGIRLSPREFLFTHFDIMVQPIFQRRNRRKEVRLLQKALKDDCFLESELSLLGIKHPF